MTAYKYSNKKTFEAGQDTIIVRQDKGHGQKLAKVFGLFYNFAKVSFSGHFSPFK